MTDQKGKVSLEKNRLFAGVRSKTLRSALEQLPRRNLEEGRILFQEGAVGRSLFLLEAGSVKVSKKGRGGAQEVLTQFGPGDFFGEMALLNPGPRSATAEAVSPTVLAEVDGRAFDQLVALAPGKISTNLAREVAARLRNSNEKFMEELLRQERLGLVGSMAASIIHDFKNPMSTVLFTAELMARRNDDEKSRKYFQIISRSMDRMVGMTRDLLDFSRGETTQLQLEELTADRLFEGLEEEGFEPMRQQGIEVFLSASYKGVFQGDPGRLGRMFLNIMKNAREAMEECGGRFTFSLSKRGQEVVFRLADTGLGMSPEVATRIFEPFFTHEKAGGTGLGMAIVKAAVEAHHGTITIDNKPGRGVTFAIRIPVHPGKKRDQTSPGGSSKRSSAPQKKNLRAQGRSRS